MLTISPDLLQQLADSQDIVTRKLSAEEFEGSNIQKLQVNESSFRFELNDDPMATEKLAEGIRVFAADADKLGKFIETLR